MLGDSGGKALQTKKISHIYLLSFISKGRGCVLFLLQDATVRVYLLFLIPPLVYVWKDAFSSGCKCSSLQMGRKCL